MTTAEILEGFRHKPGLCVALDYETVEENLWLAEEVAEEVDVFKLNDDGVDEAGIRPLIQPFVQFGKPIMMDEKLFKGRTRMSRRVKNAAAAGASLITVSALVDRLMVGPIMTANELGVHILVNTVLTHMDEAYCQEYHGRSLPETVRWLAEKAEGFGAFGITLPGTALKGVAHLNLFKATPGIRPDWSVRDNDQESEVTPAQAVRGGSSLLICHSPIALYADGPRAAARRIREEMAETLSS